MFPPPAVPRIRSGRLVTHDEPCSLPLWKGHDLKVTTGRSPPGQPLLVLETAAIPLRTGGNYRSQVEWALVTNGGCTGWLPTPLGRLTLLDEEE